MEEVQEMEQERLQAQQMLQQVKNMETQAIFEREKLQRELELIAQAKEAEQEKIRAQTVELQKMR